MTFDESQVLRLFSRLPLWRLIRQREARRFIEVLVRDAEELAGPLCLFPGTRYEQLDSHYGFLDCLGAANDDLIADLCSHYAWQGVVWAAWIGALAPVQSYRRPLVEATPRAPHNRWLIDLALCEIDAANWTGDAALQRSVRRLRVLLARVPPVRIELRRRPTGLEALQLGRERDEATQAYRRCGLQAARAVIDRSAVLRFHLPR